MHGSRCPCLTHPHAQTHSISIILPLPLHPSSLSRLIPPQTICCINRSTNVPCSPTAATVIRIPTVSSTHANCIPTSPCVSTSITASSSREHQPRSFSSPSLWPARTAARQHTATPLVSSLLSLITSCHKEHGRTVHRRARHPPESNADAADLYRRRR